MLLKIKDVLTFLLIFLFGDFIKKYGGVAMYYCGRSNSKPEYIPSERVQYWLSLVRCTTDEDLASMNQRRPR